MAGILGLLRVRNEARWIDRAVRSMFPLCSRVLLFDDHSTDGTPDIASRAGAIVTWSPFAADDFNEVRDKNYLLDRARVLEVPDWCLMIDGDEMLAPGAQEKILKSLERWSNREPIALSFPIIYLWDREDQVRSDRWYRTFRRPSLFRWIPGQRFQSPYPNGLHCSNVPAGLCFQDTDAAFLHFGYLHKTDRIRKYHYYNSLDPNNAAEDCYRHMVIGDVFPAASQFRYAGPLELKPLDQVL